MATFDSAVWTGRRPHMPKVTFDLACRWFAIHVGPDFMVDAFTIRLNWGENKSRTEGASYYKQSRSWLLVTRHQVISGHF